MTEPTRRDVLTPPAPDSQDRARPTADLPILSLDEIADLYLGQKILLEITAFDDNHIPSHGRVLGHWPNTRENQPIISAAFPEMLARRDKPKHGYFFFEADRYIRSGEEMRRLLKEAEEADDA